MANGCPRMAARFFNQQMRRMAGVCSPKDRRLSLRGTSISCFRSSAPPDRKRGRLSPSGEFRATSASLLSGRVAPACRRACSVNHSHRLLPEWSKGSGASPGRSKFSRVPLFSSGAGWAGPLLFHILSALNPIGVPGPNPATSFWARPGKGSRSI